MWILSFLLILASCFNFSSNSCCIMLFLVWYRGLLLWCTPGAPVCLQVKEGSGLWGGEFWLIFVCLIYLITTNIHRKVHENGIICRKCCILTVTCVRERTERTECVFRMSVCMYELIPISNQLSFNISVLLGPPVGRAKLWVI